MAFDVKRSTYSGRLGVGMEWGGDRAKRYLRYGFLHTSPSRVTGSVIVIGLGTRCYDERGLSASTLPCTTPPLNHLTTFRNGGCHHLCLPTKGHQRYTQVGKQRSSMVPLGRIGYSEGEWMITTIVFGFNNTGIFAYLKGLTDDSPLGF